MSNHRVTTSAGLIAFLLFAGVGCRQFADDSATQALQPIVVPVQSLEEAKKATVLANAVVHTDEERMSDDVSVGLILTDGSKGYEDAVGEVVGCNDKVVFKKIHRAATSDLVVSDALKTLLSQKQSSIDGLHNALWQSALEVDKIRSTDGVTTEVWLKGKVVSGGACDDPRIKAQVERTVARFRPDFTIFLNGSEKEWRCLGDQSGECN